MNSMLFLEVFFCLVLLCLGHFFGLLVLCLHVMVFDFGFSVFLCVLLVHRYVVFPKFSWAFTYSQPIKSKSQDGFMKLKVAMFLITLLRPHCSVMETLLLVSALDTPSSSVLP